jgi:uncharacterized protein YfaS (alpha-2-macroglobulin family)
MISLRRVGLLAFAALALASATEAQTRTPDLQGLHDALKLTAAQEPAWRTFVAASFAQTDESARQESAARMMPTLNAPRRVDLSIALMQTELQILERRGAALKTFYASLTPAQQAVFDRETAPRQQQ